MILAIDLGTTGITVMLFDKNAKIKDKVYKEFKQYYPNPSWVEHDAVEIWQVSLKLIKQIINQNNNVKIVSIGLTNQRETSVVWNKKTGLPVHNAIVWQCRRTSNYCKQIKESKMAAVIQQKTGLIVDAYFSASKIKWILDSDKLIRDNASKGDLLFGTIDTWIIWNLSQGKFHVTDYTNASRTMLYNINNLEWDADLCDYFTIPKTMLANVLPSMNSTCFSSNEILGLEIPISGIAGDQQAALFGQACFEPGMVKNTYGTGCFMLMNTGKEKSISKNGLLTTLACSFDSKPNYALEGAVFMAGACVQWLRDELKMINNASETENLAQSVENNNGVYLIPAFVGLGAPYWSMDVRAALMGLTRGANKAHIVRATLEAICYQTRDVLNLMESESDIKLSELRVDGGATANNFLMQFQADVLHVNVNRPKLLESTVFGAALLAGLASGFWKKNEIDTLRDVDLYFKPDLNNSKIDTYYEEWKVYLNKLL